VQIDHTNTPPIGERPVSLTRRVLGVVGTGLMGGALVVLTGGLVHHVATAEAWHVGRVEVTGSQHASTTAIRHLSDVRQDGHLFGVDLGRAVEGVQQHPWVKHAEATRKFPGVVEISVEEHEAQMLLALEDLWYVNGDGLVFKQAHASDLDHPILTGLDPHIADARPDLAKAVVQGGLNIISAAKTQHEVAPSTISEVRFNASTGFTVIQRNGSRLLVGFGDPLHSYTRLSALLDHGLMLDPPVHVDLDAGDVAIVTPLDAVPNTHAS
jgi:hypothetical protein